MLQSDNVISAFRYSGVLLHYECMCKRRQPRCCARVSYVRTAGQEALYARFWILPLEGVNDMKGEGLGFWWGLRGGARGGA